MSPIARFYWDSYRAGAPGWVTRQKAATQTFVEFDPTLNWPNITLPRGPGDEGGANVGPRPGVVLSQHTGDYTIPGPNHTFGQIEIWGDLIVPTGYTGAYGEDVLIHGVLRTTTADYAARGSSYNAGGLHLKWFGIDGSSNAPQPWNLTTHGTAGAWQNGMGGGNYTLEYGYIRRFVDGVSANNTGDATLYCVRIYDGVYRSWHDDTNPGAAIPGYTWPSHSDRAVHGDGIQISGWDGWVFTGCNIGGPRTPSSSRGTALDPRVAGDLAKIQATDAARNYKNAGLMVGSSDPGSNPVGLTLSYSRLQGGAATINLDAKTTTPSDLLSGVNIHHVLIGQTDGYQIYRRAAGTPNIDTATVLYEPTMQPATIRTY